MREVGEGRGGGFDWIGKALWGGKLSPMECIRVLSLDAHGGYGLALSPLGHWLSEPRWLNAVSRM